MNDTIIAISTTVGVGAISIVRLSGEKAIEIVNNNFKGPNLEKVKTHTINYGYIMDDKEKCDEVLVSVMRAPKTFTTEDIVEINCHGGIITTNKVLEVMLRHGARLAEPGEFTKRAFLNNRIDLVESEAIIDLITSKTKEQQKLALSNLNGTISNLIKEYRSKILNMLSSIEVNNDYPEYQDIEVITNKELRELIITLKTDLLNLINESENKKIFQTGIKTAIIGKPNVGKSSILNKLLEEDKAIVTNVEGTTRDTVEGELIIDGILLEIIDTAGIRESMNIVEKIGIEKSLKLIDQVDLIILVLDNNKDLTKDDLNILEKTKNKERIIVINKNDLPRKIKEEHLIDLDYIETNTNSIDGVKKIKEKIKEIYNLEKIKTNDFSFLSNARQIALAKKAFENIKEAEKGIEQKLPIDLVSIDLKECFENLGEIIGETYSEEIIDNLFSNFCVGK